MNCIPNNTKYRFRFRNKVTSNFKSHNKIQRNCGKVQGKLLWQNQTLNNALEFANHYSLHHTRAKMPYSANIKLHKENLNQSNKLISYASNAAVRFGRYGVVFQNHGQLSAKLITTLRLDVAKMLKKRSRVWLRLCCDTPVTARPVETRMGKGKGSISYWASRVRPGQVLFEFSGVSELKAYQILRALSKKSPQALKLIRPKM